MIHEEIEELLGAYALHATEPDEDREIDAHLAECPRCRAEVQAHFEVAAMLGGTASEVPAGLWEKISASVGELPAPGSPQLRAVPPPLSPPSSLGAVARRPAARVWGAVVAVAAALIALLGVEVAHLHQQVDNLTTAMGRVGLSGAAAQVALGAHHTIVLDSAPGSPQVAKILVAPSGDAYWVSSSLRTLPSSQTYQLWGLARGQIVSLGLVGPDPRAVAGFRLEGTISQVMVTAEPSGGEPKPTLPVVAQGKVPAGSVD
jgi:hypothetical protein